MSTDLETAAAQPEQIKTTSAHVKNRPLAELIEAAKFLAGSTAGKSNRLGIRFRKFIPPSINGQVDTSADS